MAEQEHKDRVYFNSGGYQQYRQILTSPDAKDTFEEIPTVDVSQIFSLDLNVRKKIAEQIGQAAEHVGFFYAVNPPVSTEKMDRAFEVIERFFSLPLDDKMAVDCMKSNAAKGYQPQGLVGPNAVVRESFSLGNDYTEPEQQAIKIAPEGSVPLNQWPQDTVPEFRAVLYEYYHEVYRFAKKLIQIFALALGLEESALDSAFEAPLTDVTIQHYPAQPSATEPIELLFPHADFGVLTLLLQKDVAGLQVLNANGIWIPAPPKKHSYVVNTGNYVEAWTNGRWPATVHRVFAKLDVERFSLPFFISPDPSYTLAPLRELMQPGEQPKYEPRNIGQRQVKGMLYARPTHPFVQKMKAMGLDEEEYNYEMLSLPPAEVR